VHGLGHPIDPSGTKPWLGKSSCSAASHSALLMLLIWRGYGTNGRIVCCRVRLSRTKPCRNTIAEQTRDQASVPCTNRGCQLNLPYGKLKQHQAECAAGAAECGYARIGCDWAGERRLLASHEVMPPAFAIGGDVSCGTQCSVLFRGMSHTNMT
jgi:hypothetical protein